jgi:type II secretory pathway component PulK
MMVMAMVTMAVVAAMAVQVAVSLVATHRQTRRYHDELQAAWLAESALDRAAARLADDGKYEGETWQPVVAGESEEEAGSVEIAVERMDDGGRRITARAHWPDVEVHRVLVERERIVPSPEKETP